MKKILVMAAMVAAMMVGQVQAALVSYNLFGSAGNQAFNAPSEVASNLTGLNLTRSAGLTASSAANSMSSSGWDVGDYYSFGFSVDNGYFSDLTELQIGTRSSNTGPGFLELYYSGDGFTNSLGQIAHQGTSFSNTVFDLSGLTGLTGVVEFRLRMDSTVNANGGTVAATGTNRITNYFFDNVDTGGFRVLGTVSAIPEPSALLLVGSIIGAGALRRRRS